jgi:hypothetical protein
LKRITSSWICRIAIPALAVLGSTLTVKPVLGAEPAEELKAIRDLLAKIDARMENQNTISLQLIERWKADYGQLKSDLTQLRDEISQARRELADFKARVGGGTTSSLYAGRAPPSMSASNNGSIRLVNNYLTDMTAVINGITHVVPPGQTVSVPVYSGEVSYQVVQTQPWPKRTTIRPGEVLKLELYPRY